MRIAVTGLGLVLVSALAIGACTSARAEVENHVFTSSADDLRLVVPRGWRETDQPSYPGLLLWMMRSQPEGRMVLTAQAFTRAVYCSWPVKCRTNHDALPSKLACSLRHKLQIQRMKVGPSQAGPKENEQAGMPSVWFEYDDGHHFFRQAVALADDRVVSLVLSTDSADARSAHVRSFEQALRTLRTLRSEERTPTAVPTAFATAPRDGGVTDAGAVPDAAPATPGIATFESAPAPKIDPIGPCTK